MSGLRKVWFESRLILSLNYDKEENINDWLWKNLKDKDKETLHYVMVILYGTWWARNKNIFEGIYLSVDDIINYADNQLN